MAPSSSSRASSKRSSPRRDPPSSTPPPPPPLRRTPQSPPRRIACCGMEITLRAAALASLAVLSVSPIAWRCLSGEVDAGSDSYAFRIVNEFPHDPAAFTQGLLYVENDTLYESTGLYHQSSVRKVHLQTGKVLDIHELDGSLFGEGLTLLGSRLFQVTWLTRRGFIYDLHNLSQIGSFTHYMKDGWGLATDGEVIFGSDGTSSLYIMDPRTLKVNTKNTIRYEESEVRALNELEYIRGEIWANVWMTDCIARISPTDGKVLSWILAHPLRESLIQAGYNGIDVLNGIAWDKINDRIFVTGKLWPKLYEVKLVHVSGLEKQRIKHLCNLL